MKLVDEELAASLYSHSHFHDQEPNPTAELMRQGAQRIRSLSVLLAAATDCIKSLSHGTTETIETLEQSLRECIDKKT